MCEFDTEEKSPVTLSVNACMTKECDVPSFETNTLFHLSNINVLRLSDVHASFLDKQFKHEVLSRLVVLCLFIFTACLFLMLLSASFILARVLSKLFLMLFIEDVLVKFNIEELCFVTVLVLEKIQRWFAFSSLEVFDSPKFVKSSNPSAPRKQIKNAMRHVAA